MVSSTRKVGLMTIDTISVENPSNHQATTCGAYEAQSNISFQVLVPYFSSKHITLHISMPPATGSGKLEYTVIIQQEIDYVNKNGRKQAEIYNGEQRRKSVP